MYGDCYVLDLPTNTKNKKQQQPSPNKKEYELLASTCVIVWSKG